METLSASLALCAGNSPVIGEFPSQRPVTRSFGVFFDLRLNKQLGKQSRRHRAHCYVICDVKSVCRPSLHGEMILVWISQFPKMLIIRM